MKQENGNRSTMSHELRKEVTRVLTNNQRPLEQLEAIQAVKHKTRRSR